MKFIEWLKFMPINRLAAKPVPKRRPRGTCPTCGREVALLKDGTPHIHRCERKPDADSTL